MSIVGAPIGKLGTDGLRLGAEALEIVLQQTIRRVPFTSGCKLTILDLRITKAEGTWRMAMKYEVAVIRSEEGVAVTVPGLSTSHYRGLIKRGLVPRCGLGGK